MSGFYFKLNLCVPVQKYSGDFCCVSRKFIQDPDCSPRNREMHSFALCSVCKLDRIQVTGIKTETATPTGLGIITWKVSEYKYDKIKETERRGLYYLIIL